MGFLSYIPGARTLKNFSRKADKYGNVHFISFLASILSRLAYVNDKYFLSFYESIMGQVIPDDLLEAINRGVKSDKLDSLLDDETLYKLDSNGKYKDYLVKFSDKNYLDVLKLNIPQNVNIITREISGTPKFVIQPPTKVLGQVKYISIAWSNYGEIYVVADKRMPNIIFVIFRGTYSAKTAALYAKVSSAIPLEVGKDKTGNSEKFLYGIFKPTAELIHTIIEATRWLAVNFLEETKPNSIKIFTTGHSLGGAMCTNFAYLWMGIKETAPYNAAPYNVLSDDIICISLGSPRPTGSYVAKKFCNLVKDGKILYLRITTRGDPVPALPPNTGTSYEHPCSSDKEMRERISEDCNAQLTMRPKPNVKYTGDIDCQNYKTRTYLPNMLSHTIYLDILYTSAVNIGNFLKGIGLQMEIKRTPNGSTVCRLIMGSDADYKVVFFDVNKVRKIANKTDIQQEKELVVVAESEPVAEIAEDQPVAVAESEPVETSKLAIEKPIYNMDLEAPVGAAAGGAMFGGPVSEDIKMSQNAFNKLIEEMKPLKGDLNPKEGAITDTDKIFVEEMVTLSYPPAAAASGGRRTRKIIRRNKKYSKKNKRIHHRNKKTTKRKKY